jgi:hypothetical protein
MRNFVELRLGEVLRIHLLSTLVNRGKKKGRGGQTLLLLLVAGNFLPLAQPLGRDSLLLISDVLSDVGQSPKSLPQSDRPAGKKRGQGPTDQEDRKHLPEAGSP